MDDTVVGHDVRGGDFCFVDHDTASGGDGEFRALHGFNFTGFNVCRHHFAGDHMVGEHGCELGLVFEQGIQVGFRNLCKSGVCRCKNREWALTFQGFEISGRHGRVNDVLGVYAECYAEG